MQGKKVLIVDDEPGLRDILAQQFSGRGWEVATAVDGEDALAKVHADRFDLVLLDLLMPKMTGLQFLERVKEEPALHYLVMVVLTASAMGDDLKRAIEMGAKDYFIKSHDSLEKILNWADTYVGRPTQTPAGD